MIRRSKQPPSPPSAPRPELASTLLERVLRGLASNLDATLPRVLAGQDPEAIHDMRVAIRKIRTLLKAARPIFGRFHADAVRAEYTVLHRSTGSLRDEEVFRETMTGLKLQRPVPAAFLRMRMRREAMLARRARQLVRSGQVRRAQSMLIGLLSLPVLPRRDAVAHKFAQRTTLRAHKRTLVQRDASTTDVVALHDLRIAFKELRYAAELLTEALPPDLTVLAEPAAKFQKRLGEIHDCDMALSSVARARALGLPDKARLRRALLSLRARKVQKYLGELGASALALPPEATPEAAPQPAAAPVQADGGVGARKISTR
jgi:CHAD domain-containing protein